MEQGKREEAEGVCRDLIERHPNDSGKTHIDVLALFFLPGQSEATVEHAKERARNVVVSTYWKTSRDVLQFMGDDITEDDLIGRAGKSERDRAVAYFAIGMRRLAEGRRLEAKESFEKSAANPVYYWSDPTWARAFVARMEKDPTWPDWLPASPVGAEAK